MFKIVPECYEMEIVLKGLRRISESILHDKISQKLKAEETGSEFLVASLQPRLHAPSFSSPRLCPDIGKSGLLTLQEGRSSEYVSEFVLYFSS